MSARRAPRRGRKAALLLAAIGAWSCASHAPPSTPDHPISDHPVTPKGDDLDAAEGEMTRLIAQSRGELGSVRKRFMAGLRYGERLYLTVRLYKPDRSFEQAYVWIEDWPGSTVRGIIESDLVAFDEPKRGDRLEFPETNVVDWTIVGPDGTEEGNRVGHYLESRGQP